MTQTSALEFLVKTQQEQLISQAESIKHLTERVNELLSQIAWLNRQLFGRKSEKLAHLDPNQPSLFEEVLFPQQIAISRKNFLFCGNHHAAENTAIICSLHVKVSE